MKASTIMSRFTSNTKMFDAIQTFNSSSSVSSSIEFDIAELFVSNRSSESKSSSRSLFTLETIFHAVVNYEESFDSNKRSFVKESRSVQLSFFFSVSDSVANEDDRRRRKKQKRVIKKMKSQSVIEMFNEILEKYDIFIFIRQMLKANKVNIN